MYKKTQPHIKLEAFKKLVAPITRFYSITGKEYVIRKSEGNIVHFERTSTQNDWKLNLEILIKAYQETNISKTTDLKPFFPRTQSPALGLLIATGLLSK